MLKDKTFGFLQCLHQVLEVVIDERQEIIRLMVPNWKEIEELHMKSLSRNIFLEQKLASQSAANNMVYLARMTGLKPAQGARAFQQYLNDGQ